MEQDRWLARATNTGLTAFVDPWGRLATLGDIRDGSGLFVDGFLTRTVRARSGHTLYFALHPYLPALAFILLLFILWPLARLGRAQDPSAGAPPRTPPGGNDSPRSPRSGRRRF